MVSVCPIVAILLLCLALYPSGPVASMVGNYRTVNTNDTKVLKMAAFATDEINKRSNNIYIDRLMNVFAAQKQLVNGIKYKMKLRLGATLCRKNVNEDYTLENCPLLIGGNLKVQDCDVLVYEQIWTNHTELSKFDCSSISTWEE